MKEPYLIQRLKKPYKIEVKDSLMGKLAEAFTFGGGMSKGGIRKEAWDIITQIWRYDYMGSAEFEFGAVPESLERMAKSKKLIKFETLVKANHYSYGNKKRLSAEGTVHIICDKEFKDQVAEYIRVMAAAQEKYRTKEYVGLAQSICGAEYYTDTVGWHDIINDYMFFTDKEMFDNTCKLFGL